jgi:HAD superfamily hydrolase (TIGR01549 family)
MNFKAVVFDCDGVLFDSLEANRAYYNALLEKLNLPPLSKEQLDFAHCHTVFEVIDFVIPDPILRKKAQNIRKKTKYRQFLNYVKPEPYMKDSLADFKNQFKVGMATSRTTTVQLLLDYYDILSYFDIIISSTDVKQVKPHPESLYKIITHFSVKPKEMVYVGDAWVDAEMAKRANVSFIAYKNSNLSADFHAKTFLQIAEIIKG